MILGNDALFAHYLHGINLPSILFLDLKNLQADSKLWLPPGRHTTNTLAASEHKGPTGLCLSQGFQALSFCKRLGVGSLCKLSCEQISRNSHDPLTAPGAAPALLLTLPKAPWPTTLSNRKSEGPTFALAKLLGSPAISPD